MVINISKNSTKSSSLPRSNLEITAQTVRLVGEDGAMLGIVSIREAQAMAKAKSLDLVEISPNNDPPVCKIMDFGKYKYEIKKKAQESRKKQKTVVLKEIKLRPAISDHDLGIKIKHAIKFLQEENKVKFSVSFKGREITHNELGFEICNKVKQELEPYGKIEQDAKLEGKNIYMLVVPKKV
jgi:translation initiation factor IF-3